MKKVNGNAAVFYQNKEMQALYNPFKIVYVNDTIEYVQFKASDSLWSRNFKRAIASAFQLKNIKIGAFVEEEVKCARILYQKTPLLSTLSLVLCIPSRPASMALAPWSTT